MEKDRDLGLVKTRVVIEKEKSSRVFFSSNDFITQVREVREFAKIKAGADKDIFLNLSTGKISLVGKKGSPSVFFLLNLALELFPESFGKELAFLILEETASALIDFK